MTTASRRPIQFSGVASAGAKAVAGSGAVRGQHTVVLVGALGRCPAVNLNGVHGDILVGHHDVERVGNLTQLAAVVHVVGLHLPAVHDEGDVG